MHSISPAHPAPLASSGAATARSILACPSGLSLEVDAEPVPVAHVVLGDDGGRVTFTCERGSTLGDLAAGRPVARATVRSRVRGSGGDSLVLCGRLAVSGTADCQGCADTHLVVTLAPAAVLLLSGGQRHQVPLADYLSPAHLLGPGHLQRNLEHVESHHREELRHAVAASTGTPLDDVAGASMVDLDVRGATLRWVDPNGAHEARLPFARAAGSPADLARLLRESLGAHLH